MANSPLTVLSCIQPTSEMHIGNYFGAVQNWVKLQDEHRCIYGVVDLHAMTMPFDPQALRDNSERMALDLLAVGIDPAKSILFIQSMVPEHSELYWILSCFCPYGDLSRMTQFKDKSDTVRESGAEQLITAGLFTYPILQAADILIYKAQGVPVGRDQVQHLELSRELARRLNNKLKPELFPEPKPLLTETPKILSLADPTRKMSKSLGAKHFVGLFEDEATVRGKVKSAVTDTGGGGDEMSPGVDNLFKILDACGKIADAASLRRDYEAGQLKYKPLKDAVADALVELTGAMRARRAEVEADREGARAVLRESANRAREIAQATLKEVREVVGLMQVGG